MADQMSKSPTSGCRFPAALTSVDMEACVGITSGGLGDPANYGRVKAARAKIAMWPFVGDHKAIRARSIQSEQEGHQCNRTRGVKR
jgi:hypothetical protein